jgi:hypothetical protein
MSKPRLTALALILLIVGTVIAAESTEKKDVKFTPEQQAAIDKIQAHGGLVLRVASSTDTLDVLFNLSGKEGTDGIIGQVKALPNVVKLNLAGTDISDKGLAEIAGLKELTALHLERTKITDAGLVHLKGLEKLEYLNLYGSEVGDKGLEQLKGLKNLKKLYLWQSKVTPAAAEALTKARPDLYINTGWVAPKDPPKEVAVPAPTKPEELTIKAIMEKAHKGDDTILTRALAKKSNPDELKQLLAYYQAMEKLKPKKGDEAVWKTKAAALTAAADLLVKGDDKGIAALKAASDCKACHSVYK